MPRSARSSSTSRYDKEYRRYQRTASMMTSGGNRKPAKLDCGACTAGRCGISPACPSQRSVNATEPRHELRRALDDLPSRDRAIVVLRFFGDLTQTQIGARLGLSPMHVSRLLVSSLTTLRTRLHAE
jgi:RNA polymerase sigma factor (sigma-70 family)